MTAAPLPANEAERLVFLQGLTVLDTLPSKVLDGLTRCAARLCACPISLLSLVDKDRQWFKSRVGLEPAQTPRDFAFCAHAIHSPELLEVPDTLADARFADNPLVLGDPNIRFYAGVPVGDLGHRLGTLCVIDTVPRVLTADERQSLTDLARLASAWFAARREHLELEQQRARALTNLARLEGVAQQVPGLIFEYRQSTAGADVGGSFSYISDRSRDLLELEPADLLACAEAWRERVHPADHAGLLAMLMRAARLRQAATQEFRVRLPRAGVRWRALQVAPSPGPDGSVLWRGLLTDVSRRRERDAEVFAVRERWRLAVTAAQLGLITLHPRSGAVELDARARLQHALPTHGAPLDLDAWLALFEFDAAGRNALRGQIRNMQPGQTLSLACQLPATATEAGRRLEVVALAQVLTSGGDAEFRVVGTCRDVTGQYEGEQARRQLFAAEETSREKRLFLSRVSHELRTPLNAILGFTQLLQSNALDPLSPHQQTQVRHTYEAGRLLLNLINNVLDLSAGQDTRRLVLGPVDVNEIVSACEPMVSQMAREAEVQIEIDSSEDLPPAQADPLALKQVLLNLMTNAIKYNRPGGRMRVSARAFAQTLHITVSDEGEGLSDGQLARLFQPFDRLGAERSRTEGTGLGLLITRELVEAMRGRIDVHSVPDRGSAFTVELQVGEPLCQPTDAVPPAATVDAATRRDPPPATDAMPVQRSDEAAAAGVRPESILLYIEDEPLNALLVQEALRPHPHLKLTLAPDGPTGLALARGLRPAVVLSDINLPGLSGLDVVRALRADAAWPRPVCIALSADAMQAQIDAALEAGFDDYWTKPVDLSTVPARLESWLRVACDAAAAEGQA